MRTMKMKLRRARSAAAAVFLIAAAGAQATPQCSVSTSAVLSFGSVVALASTGDVASDTGSSFWVNCNAEVAGAPAVYSSSPRVMSNGDRQLPFTLSAVAPGGAALPSASPGASLSIPRNGMNQPVVLYGRLRAADFKALPGGHYSTNLVITIEY